MDNRIGLGLLVSATKILLFYWLIGIQVQSKVKEQQSQFSQSGRQMKLPL